MTRRQTLTVSVLSLAHGMNHSFLVFFSPLLVLIRHDQGWDHLTVGALVTLAYALYGIGSLPAGVIGDRLGHKGTIVASTGLAALGCLVPLVSPSYAAMLLSFFLIGAGASLYHPPALAYISMVVDGTAVGKAMGVHGIGANIILAAAPALSGLVAARHSWQAAFALWGVVGVILAVLLIVALPEVKRAEGSSRAPAGGTGGHGEASTASEAERSPWKTVLSPAMVAILALTTVHGFAFSGSIAYLAPYLQEVRGEGVALSGAIAAILFAGGILGQPVGGQLADRWDRMYPVWIATAMAGVSLALFPYLPVGPLLLAVVGVIGIAVFMKQPPVTALVSDCVPASLRGTAYGLFFFVTNGAGALAPLAASMLADGGRLDLFFPLLAAMTVLTVPLLVYLGRTLVRQAAPPQGPAAAVDAPAQAP